MRSLSGLCPLPSREEQTSCNSGSSEPLSRLRSRSDPLLFPQREELKDLHTYCVYNNLPSGLRQEMLDFMQLKFRISEKRRDVLDKFPRPIRARVAKLLHRSYLEGADLFQDCSPEMLEQMVGLLFLCCFCRCLLVLPFKAYYKSLRSESTIPIVSAAVYWAPNSRRIMKV